MHFCTFFKIIIIDFVVVCPWISVWHLKIFIGVLKKRRLNGPSYPSRVNTCASSNSNSIIKQYVITRNDSYLLCCHRSNWKLQLEDFHPPVPHFSLWRRTETNTVSYSFSLFTFISLSFLSTLMVNVYLFSCFLMKAETLILTTNTRIILMVGQNYGNSVGYNPYDWNTTLSSTVHMMLLLFKLRTTHQLS